MIASDNLYVQSTKFAAQTIALNRSFVFSKHSNWRLCPLSFMNDMKRHPIKYVFIIIVYEFQAVCSAKPKRAVQQEAASAQVHCAAVEYSLSTLDPSQISCLAFITYSISLAPVVIWKTDLLGQNVVVLKAITWLHEIRSFAQVWDTETIGHPCEDEEIGLPTDWMESHL